MAVHRTDHIDLCKISYVKGLNLIENIKTLENQKGSANIRWTISGETANFSIPKNSIEKFTHAGHVQNSRNGCMHVQKRSTWQMMEFIVMIVQSNETVCRKMT